MISFILRYLQQGVYLFVSTDAHKGQMRHEGSAVEALNQPHAY